MAYNENYFISVAILDSHSFFLVIDNTEKMTPMECN